MNTPTPFLRFQHLLVPFFTSTHLFMSLYSYTSQSFFPSLHFTTFFVTSLHLPNPPMFGRFVSGGKFVFRVFLCHSCVEKFVLRDVRIWRFHCIFNHQMFHHRPSVYVSTHCLSTWGAEPEWVAAHLRNKKEICVIVCFLFYFIVLLFQGCS